MGMYSHSSYTKEIYNIQKKKKGKGIEMKMYPYMGERDVLHILIERLYTENPDKFQDEEEVFQVFVKAMLTPNIRPLVDLIEDTFGPGTFREIDRSDKSTEDTISLWWLKTLVQTTKTRKQKEQSSYPPRIKRRTKE
jgi:hypothetical protein